MMVSKNKIAYMKKYRIRTANHRHLLHKNYVLKIKREVLTHYGKGNVQCVLHYKNFPLEKPVIDIRVLTIDHINGDGAKQRKRLGKILPSGHPFYRWLKNNSYPNGYQVLCMNCQFIKRIENKENGQIGINQIKMIHNKS